VSLAVLSATTGARSASAVAPECGLIRRVAGAVVLGILLGAIDAACAVNLGEWAADPGLAGRALVRVVAAYAALMVVAATALRWRALVRLSVAGFTVLQVLAWYYRNNPQVRLGPVLLVLAVSAIGATVVVPIASWVLGRRLPRWGVIAAVLTCFAVAATAAWQYPERPVATLAAHDVPIAPTSAPAQGSPNVLLLTLDTLRADRVGVYGYQRVRTPNLDALANEGVLFTRAMSQAPLTPPSHASIFTGLYPARHALRGFAEYNRLPPEHRTLAEILHGAGYATAAVVAAAPLAPGTGLDRGFDVYDFTLPPNRYPFFGCRDALLAKVLKRAQLVPDRWAYRTAEEQTDRAVHWLEQHPDGPFFLWVHYFDAHDPYAPPVRYLRAAAHPGASLTDALSRSYLYDSEVAYLDEQIGRLADYLRRHGRLANTVVVGISDHGEGLGEHNYVGHSYRLFEEQIHSAFFIRYPARIQPGSRVATQVRSIDLMPTLLDVLQLDAPEGLQGTSLLPLVQATGPQPHRLSFSETLNNPKRRLVSASDGRYKLIVSLDGGDPWLSDLQDDPSEMRNYVAREPQVVARLRQALDDYAAEGAATQGSREALDPAVRERLRALGYVK
jgi:arylsulfatase A-like enzyme